MRECSRKRPTIDRTVMLSLTPGTPGRSRQMPRTIRSISTPAWEAAYRARMQAASTGPEKHGFGDITTLHVSYDDAPIDMDGTEFRLIGATDEITLPAGEEAEIAFANEDASSIQHNIAIYEEEGGADLFVGEVIPGGQSVTYSVPALEKGEAYFQCDLHPGMNGTVTIQ